ncbi:MAG: hypothetical protein K8823_1316 [Cenarchaeum symbiont of Oopsacas minuta]|nr:hypothetical protein [Cenarchaeum symbiont of Oopsacas minuta]
MNGLQIHGDDLFVKSVSGGNFLFALTISYTDTCTIPGITVAGATPELARYTPAADAEFLQYGHCKSIDGIPATPDGKPTPALITRAALRLAEIPHIIIDAGSFYSPQTPYVHTGLQPGKNIRDESAMELESAKDAIERGREIGETLGALADCLVLGESVPGGTTTALAVLRALGIDAHTSSSMSENPRRLKETIVSAAQKRVSSEDPISISAELADPMLPFLAGVLCSATKKTRVMLAGGTQMAAVLALASSLGYDSKKTAVATTSYVYNDKSADFLRAVEISGATILVADPGLYDSQIGGLYAYSQGFAKEGAGAGGALAACMLKTGSDSKDLRLAIEAEYGRTILPDCN